MWRTNILANHHQHQHLSLYTRDRYQPCKHVLILNSSCVSWYLSVWPLGVAIVCFNWENSWAFPQQRHHHNSGLWILLVLKHAWKEYKKTRINRSTWDLGGFSHRNCHETANGWDSLQTSWKLGTWGLDDWRALLSDLSQLRLGPLWYCKGMLWCRYYIVSSWHVIPP